MLEYAWLVPLITSISFVVILLFGKRMPFKGAEVGITALFLSFFLSLVMVGAWVSRPADHDVGHAVTTAESEHAVEEGGGHEAEPIRAAVQKEVRWFESGAVEVKAGIHIDGLAVSLLFVVSLISLLVHVFSFDYMHGDERFTHYFAALSLFTTGMFVLVTASNTLQALFGWELMGLCSFMLIGHWWEDKVNSTAALKAFFTTRTGDIGLLVGVAMLFFLAGQTFNVMSINEQALAGQIDDGLLTVAAIALLCAVIGKSAQFPLHTWLPDAMAGPTPVSALIHAATMVVAGVFLIARLYGVFWQGFDLGANDGYSPVAMVGGITVVIAALLAFVQSDIKKVLAYSTVSQLGYMVMALGVGAWTAGVFHLFTHAFFKACLFLGAGSVAHSGSHHSFDMKADMGGLRKYMPVTFTTFMIGSLALAGTGAWPGTGGNGDYYLMLVFGLLSAAMTAAYMTRCVYLSFHGEPRGHAADPHHPPHESGPRIVIPLYILSALAIVAGFANLPNTGALDWVPESVALRFEHFYEPKGAYFPSALDTFSHPEFNIGIALASTLIGLVGIGLAYAYWFQGRFHGLTERNRVARAGYVVLENKYYFDHLYTGVIAGGTKGPVARAANWFNQNVLDGIVNGVAAMATGVARWTYRYIDQGVVDGTVNGSGYASESFGQFLRRLQSGRVQQYGALLFGGAVVLAGVFVFAI